MTDKMWYSANNPYPESEAYEVGQLLVTNERKKGLVLLWAILTGKPKYEEKVWICKQ